MTPGVGSTLRSNKDGQLISFVSGSLRVTTVDSVPAGQTQSTIEQNNLTYTFNGDTYVSIGTITTRNGTGTIGGSGQIQLMKNGAQVGRLFATDKGVFFETSDVLQPFGSTAAPRFKAARAHLVR